MRPLSIVPETVCETVYLVLDDFGRLGRAYVETDERKADLETVIDGLMTAQFAWPIKVVAFNTTEGWAKDVSRDVAKEVLERAELEQRDLSEATRDFIEVHTRTAVATFLQSK